MALKQAYNHACTNTIIVVGQSHMNHITLYVCVYVFFDLYLQVSALKHLQVLVCGGHLNLSQTTVH